MTRASYTGDDGIERCLDCDGFLAEPGAKCKRCANRLIAVKDADEAATKAAAAQESSENQKAADSARISNWRRRMLARHIAGLLATKSGSVERQRFIERYPIAGIFR